jgi:hypothetical protein
LLRMTHADAIVFVGYRFPPSDSAARRKLYEAIVNNSREFLHVHTVLGHDVNDPYTRRLLGLLDAALVSRNTRLRTTGTPRMREFVTRFGRQDRVIAHPLYAQDYFDTFELFELTNRIV